jgi:hypothetical protein
MHHVFCSAEAAVHLRFMLEPNLDPLTVRDKASGIKLNRGYLNTTTYWILLETLHSTSATDVIHLDVQRPDWTSCLVLTLTI